MPTEDIADLHVHRFDVVGWPAGLRSHGEHHLQVQVLRSADHVENPVHPELFDPVLDDSPWRSQ
jgi:hypothetical protein